MLSRCGRGGVAGGVSGVGGLVKGASGWDCGGLVIVVVGFPGFDGLLACWNWRREGDSLVRVEAVMVLVSRLWRCGVGLEPDWGMESLGRSF